MTEHADDRISAVADNVKLQLASRLMSVFGVPITAAALVFVASQILTVNTAITRMETTLAEGILPRLGIVELDIRRIDTALQLRTTNRFDKTDAREQEKRIMQRILTLENQLTDIRKAIQKNGG